MTFRGINKSCFEFKSYYLLYFFLLLLFLIPFITKGQISDKKEEREPAINFRDTTGAVLFDSVRHNLGWVRPANENNRLIKHFTLQGKEHLNISRVWTSDPHYICYYPQGPLIPGKIYSIHVCFWHQDRTGIIQKTMGLTFADGTRVTFMFTGKYLPLEKPGHD